MTSKDIKEVQEFLKSKNLDNDPTFFSIMAKNPDKVQEELDYYNSIKGKYFKHIEPNCVYYHYIHPVIHTFREWDNSESVKVKVDNYVFRARPYLHAYKESGHILSSARAGRYDDCIEITEEQYQKEISQIESLRNDAEVLLCDLTNSKDGNIKH